MQRTHAPQTGVLIGAGEGLQHRRWQDVVQDYVSLTKPGIVVWLMITAFCAMAVAAHGLPPVGTSLVTLAGLALSAGGAHAVNMWYDQDIDRLMERTKRRPVATGRVPAQHALSFGIISGLVSFVLLAVLVNWVTAWACLAGYLVYIFVYTMWLKRRSPQNIVIGGAAGAFPPVVGWASVTGHVGLGAWLMFLIIFFWTPPHFWALALFKQEDYRRAGIPMMPLVKGERSTKIQNLVYSVLVVGVSLWLARVAHLPVVYDVVAVGAGILFIGFQVRLLLGRGNTVPLAKRAFGYSLVYIAALFVAMVV